MKKLQASLLPLLAVVLFCLPAISQETIWNRTPGKGFVYEISNREAQKLLTGTRSKEISKDLLHSLIDTFDVQKGWANRPSKGHFILATIVGTKLHCDYTCVIPYQVFLLREYNAMSLQVLDPDGNIREDAKVKTAFRRIRIDPASKTYRVENDWFSGLNQHVTVELNGFRSVFDIRKHEVPAWYNDDEGDEGPAFYSYLITDKNRYKPHDKIRFKSYALSHVKFPLRKELEIWLYGYPLNIKLGMVSPQRPGSFAGEFLLHDSLKLVLDKNYTLQLREKNGRIVSSCAFKYEDYELTGNKLDLKLEKARQYYPEKNRMTITATDMNDLLLKDGKATIVVRTNTLLESFQPLSVLPDTLFFSQIDLDPAQPTVVELPCELFMKTNTVYQVEVVVLNSQNQRMETSQSATYYYSKYELITGFSNDSICFSLLKNNIPMKGVPISLTKNDSLHAHPVLLPFKEKLNPAIALFHFENELIKKDVVVSSLNPQIELVGGIQLDSFNLVLKNPQKLEVSWYIYQGSQLLTKGSGREFEYKSLIGDRTRTYYVELLYSFGGQDQSKRRQYEFREDFLNVNFDIPERVYPGQQVDATLSVFDPSGKPARNVDLTAMAVTGKLNYHVPDLPYFGTSSAPRPKSDTYSKKDLNSFKAVLDLDYKKWEPMARLDTMLYFQFMYPRHQGFIHQEPIPDSTQFAPFVMKTGQSLQIHVIEVDRRPVFFSWTQQPRAYSFYISPTGRHEITLRLCDRVLVLDSMAFARNTKTILSIDLDHLPDGTKVYEMDRKFTPTEINRHTSYVSQFKVVPNSYAYLQSEREFLPLFGKYGESNRTPNYGSILAGPILQEKKTYTQNVMLKTTYLHTGGYAYAFEDNIVYKLTPSKLLPEYLSDAIMEPMEHIHDRVITRPFFLKLQEKNPLDDVHWVVSTLDITGSDSRVRIFLPVGKGSKGMAALLFQDCRSKKIVPPSFNKFYHNLSPAYRFPEGYHSVIVLYEDGSYLKLDSIPFRPYIHIAVDLTDAEPHRADDVSLSWLLDYMGQPENYSLPSRERPGIRTGTFYSQSSTGNVSGTIYDENNEPLPGVVVMIKGTDSGTISDLYGNFSLRIDDNSATLQVMFIGYASQEIEVTRGSVVVVQLEPEIMALEEVVVVGYGTTMKRELTGSVRGVATAGVVFAPDEEAEIPEDDQPEDVIIHEAEQRLYQELLTLKSIRTDFSDVGFWEPRLYSDKEGKATFRITFPDDITRWDAVVYAMNRYAQTGMTRKTIRSYKPIMAELNVPQFLTRGDSTVFLGKVLNYTTDSMIRGKVQWSGLKSDRTQAVRFTQYHTDLLPVYAANTDSITTRFVFTRDDGYLDGEERTVPVVDQGIERAEGSLSILKNGDDVEVNPSENEKVTVTLLDNQLEIYAGEITALMHYRYDCNEQLASKLIGWISHKQVMQFEGRSFHNDGDVNRIIRRLLKNQNKEFLWSWWDQSDYTSYWMSAHILRALKCARDAGYDVDLDLENMTRKAEYKFDILQHFSPEDIDLLHALAAWNVNLKYAQYVPILDSLLSVMEQDEIKRAEEYPHGFITPFSYLKEKLLLLEIRQMKGIHYQRELLLKFKKEGMLGDVYFSDGKPDRTWYTNEMAANTIAYRIVRNDSLLNNLLVPMQMHFINSHGDGGWNTCQASGLLMNVLPDLLKDGFSRNHMATLQLSGKETKAVSRFPYTVELNKDEALHVHKESGLPVYCMQYVHERVTKAKTGIEGFRISTYFRDSTMNQEAGKTVDLIVEVTVEKQSPVEHVMIEVPIPGACSYADKQQEVSGVETHREYFKEKTLICCQKLNPGKYSFVIHLLPRFTGTYFINPAQVSLMYIPVVNANTDMKRVVVE